MNRFLNALAVALLCAGAARAAGQAQLGQVATGSGGITGASDAEGLKQAGAAAWGQTAQPAVYVDGSAAYASAAAQPPALPTATLAKGAKVEPPAPKGPGLMDKAGATLKEYPPHLLTAGIAGAAGAVVAKVAGFGLLGGIAAGAGIGLAAMYLYKKGETGAAIGAASFGLAGLALGGPIGGLAGAVVGGLGAWLLGKFFS